MKEILLNKEIFQLNLQEKPLFLTMYSVMLTEPYGIVINDNKQEDNYIRTSIDLLSEKLYCLGIKNISVGDFKVLFAELQKLGICCFYDDKLRPLHIDAHEIKQQTNIKFISSITNKSIVHIKHDLTKESTRFFKVLFSEIKKIYSLRNDLNSVKVINAFNSYIRILRDLQNGSYSYIAYYNIMQDIGIKSESSMNKYMNFLKENNILDYANAGLYLKTNGKGRIYANNVYVPCYLEHTEQIKLKALRYVDEMLRKHNWIPYAEYKASKTNKNN